MDPFKICPKCSHTWNTRDDFLKDLSICLIGFQASFKETESGHYLLNYNSGGQSLRNDNCSGSGGFPVPS